MRLVKQSYVKAMRLFGSARSAEMFVERVKGSNDFGWQRWAASLFAIHDVRQMMELQLPWWNVRATREIEAILAAKPDARVFEYGSGASTAWLAKRAGHVISVEHDTKWLEILEPMLTKFENVQILGRKLEGNDYIGAIDEVEGQFDVIVIDGRRRVDCLAKAQSRLAPGGVIVFDDSNRLRYRSAIKSCGLTETRHYGRSYCVPYPDATSMLYA